MDRDYWQRQTNNKPLFPELEWSRPENKQFAGKLLIVGGNLHGFAAAAEAHTEATEAGIGVVRVLLPDALQKTIGPILEAGEFAPSTPSGSFSQKALAELLSLSQWADGTMLAGDLGRNSETAIMLESFVRTYTGQLTIAEDATDYFIKNPAVILTRPDTMLVLSFAQFQQLAVRSQFSEPITFDMGLVRLVEMVHIFTQNWTANIIIQYEDNLIVGVNGKVSSTKIARDLPVRRVRIGAKTAVWWLQNPSKTFQALTTGLL